MAKVQNPILFSTYFGLKLGVLEAAGLIDPFLNVDTQLFIDPTLLEKSSNEIIKEKALPAFRKNFSDFLKIVGCIGARRRCRMEGSARPTRPK